MLHAQSSGEYFFIPCLANPPTSKSGDLKNKINFCLYFYSTLLYIIFTVPGKYGAPKQAKHFIPE
jgi:hypothetical protein